MVRPFQKPHERGERSGAVPQKGEGGIPWEACA